MSELHHECGIAAVYHLPNGKKSSLCPPQGREHASRLIPRMLLDMQNRGQLAAGMSTFNPNRNQLIDTHKNVGSVSEVFRLSRKNKSERIMKEYAGRAAIGHVRYATCGKEDKSYAQPFERHHIEKRKWFAFGFNGQLANYAELRKQLLSDNAHHLARETDTEIIMHEISKQFSGDQDPPLEEMMAEVGKHFDGAYSLVFLNACGDMLVARDPLGLRPLCYAIDGNLFAAASESVALLNLGFPTDAIKSVQPGEAITIVDGEIKFHQFTPTPRRAHCFFEWIYFANVASTLDDKSVYQVRSALGNELAQLERDNPCVPFDEDTIVVPVPDTSKAAADAMAFSLGVPSREGLIRNRYSGRTFIEGDEGRRLKVRLKYTPLAEVLEGKRVLLVEDSIVRSTTMAVLLDRLRTEGKAKEIHVRVACPPIVAPCFYGIDISKSSELFAPKFYQPGDVCTPEIEEQMAKKLGADSLRYLPVEAIARAVGFASSELCQACITGDYPTSHGQQLYDLHIDEPGESAGRTYEAATS